MPQVLYLFWRADATLLESSPYRACLVACFRCVPLRVSPAAKREKADPTELHTEPVVPARTAAQAWTSKSSSDVEAGRVKVPPECDARRSSRRRSIMPTCFERGPARTTEEGVEGDGLPDGRPPPERKLTLTGMVNMSSVMAKAVTANNMEARKAGHVRGAPVGPYTSPGAHHSPTRHG
jgi:hypothetical protein